MVNGASLHLESHFPGAGNALFVGVLHLAAEQIADSSGRRKGHLRIKVPALPKHTNPNVPISIVLMESVNGGKDFKRTVPEIALRVLGVADTGSAPPCNNASGEPWVELPTPLGLGGMVGLLLVVPKEAGDCTDALVEADWVNA